MIIVQKMAASLLVFALPFFNNAQAPTEEFRESAIENYYAGAFTIMGITLRPGTTHREDSTYTVKTARRCKSIVYKTLLTLPKGHREQLKELTLFYTPDGRRGLGGNSAVILRCRNVTDEELASVLVHEIGHLVDSGFFTGNKTESGSGFFDFGVEVPIDDKSLPFYQLSWENEHTLKEDSTELDFVSGYATTDPFEDFAETYAYYRLHGAEFRALVESSVILREKYEFMKRYVFEGQEFGAKTKTTVVVSDLTTRPYDVTVLPFSNSPILQSIK